jgi:hypothetical protein
MRTTFIFVVLGLVAGCGLAIAMPYDPSKVSSPVKDPASVLAGAGGQEGEEGGAVENENDTGQENDGAEAGESDDDAVSKDAGSSGSGDVEKDEANESGTEQDNEKDGEDHHDGINDGGGSHKEGDEGEGKEVDENETDETEDSEGPAEQAEKEVGKEQEAIANDDLTKGLAAANADVLSGSPAPAGGITPLGVAGFMPSMEAMGYMPSPETLAAAPAGSAVPEPASMGLLVFGALGLAGVVARRFRR